MSEAVGSKTAGRQTVGFLYVMSGPSLAGEILRLFDGRNTLGTSPECQVVLQDLGVSAKHASLRFADDEYWLHDLDSENGTYVNGDEVVKHQLQENDVITVGDTQFKFKAL